MEVRYFKRRIYFAALFVMFCMVMLGARLFYLQVINSKHYTTLSQENRIRVVPIPPTRGLIYDRNLQLLADNKPTYQIEVTPAQADDIERVVADIGQHIHLEEYHLKKIFNDVKRKQTFQSIPLKINLSEGEIARFSVNRHHFPGVEITARANRYYPLADVGTHALGYVGRINAKEIPDLNMRDYSGTSHIGKSGVEKFYEEILHGEVGYQRIEVNAQGRKLRVLQTIPSTPGADLVLTLDARLQKIAQDSLGESNGSVVAMDR